ncbi:MAG: HNH endonuclease domain-containing protein, partial [candidate division Zixibacteria bacterium]|nr:HNH endonuclease domain-containing protein [candidate division Zixibacteria bacterium]
EMVAISWYPINFFHLSFGQQDMTRQILEAFDFSLETARISGMATGKKLRQALRHQREKLQLHRLLNYVPFRLLEPFFTNQLRGVEDWKKNELISHLVEQYFETVKPLYRFHLKGVNWYIELHPEWHEYLKTNYSIIQGWTNWEWVKYLQARNPNVPAIPNKLSPPTERTSLSKQTKYWQTVMEEEEIRCIYSGQTLNGRSFDLDHSLPWSFVCHDQLWNLIPIIPSVNSAKSNYLPSMEYLDLFINTQNRGLHISKNRYSSQSWDKVTESFVSDLRLTKKDLLLEEKVRKAYLATLPSMLSLAEQTGFAPEWRYTQ